MDISYDNRINSCSDGENDDGNSNNNLLLPKGKGFFWGIFGQTFREFEYPKPDRCTPDTLKKNIRAL